MSGHRCQQVDVFETQLARLESRLGAILENAPAEQRPRILQRAGHVLRRLEERALAGLPHEGCGGQCVRGQVRGALNRLDELAALQGNPRVAQMVRQALVEREWPLPARRKRKPLLLPAPNLAHFTQLPLEGGTKDDRHEVRRKAHGDARFL